MPRLIVAAIMTTAAADGSPRHHVLKCITSLATPLETLIAIAKSANSNAAFFIRLFLCCIKPISNIPAFTRTMSSPRT